MTQTIQLNQPLASKPVPDICTPSTDQSQPSPARRKFHFVTSSRDGGLTPDAKAHIASESNRQKRLREVQAFQLRVRQGSRSLEKSPEAPPKKKTVEGCAEAEPRTAKSESSLSTSASGTSPRSVDANAVALVGRSPPRKRARTATPPSPLGLVERNLIDMDPFETMPAKMNHSAKYLVGESG